jgi:rhodanese-related sulfurtransferase
MRTAPSARIPVHSEAMSEQGPLPVEIDVRSVQQMREAGEQFLLLDVREPDEHATARIAGAQLIPMRELPTRLAELAAHKEGRIVVHCHHGGRSLRVTNFLRQQGFTQAQNMAGGIDAWSQAIDTSVPRYE